MTHTILHSTVYLLCRYHSSHSITKTTTMFTTLRFCCRNLATPHNRQLPRTFRTAVRFLASPNPTPRSSPKIVQGSILSATQCDRFNCVPRRCYSDSDRSTIDNDQPRRYPKFSNEPIQISGDFVEQLWSIYAAVKIRMTYDEEYSQSQIRDGSSKAIEVRLVCFVHACE